MSTDWAPPVVLAPTAKAPPPFGYDRQRQVRATAAEVVSTCPATGPRAAGLLGATPSAEAAPPFWTDRQGHVPRSCSLQGHPSCRSRSPALSEQQQRSRQRQRSPLRRRWALCGSPLQNRETQPALSSLPHHVYQSEKSNWSEYHWSQISKDLRLQHVPLNGIMETNSFSWSDRMKMTSRASTALDVKRVRGPLTGKPICHIDEGRRLAGCSLLGRGRSGRSSMF